MVSIDVSRRDRLARGDLGTLDPRVALDDDQAAAGNAGQDVVGAGLDPGLPDALPRQQRRIGFDLFGGRLRDVAGDVRGPLPERVDPRRLRLHRHPGHPGDDIEQPVALFLREILDRDEPARIGILVALP